MGPPVKHKLPECFEIKIRQDNLRDQIKSQDIVSLSDYKALKDDMNLTRYSCVEFIKRQRGGGKGNMG